ARVARLADVLARRAPVVRPRAGGHRALGREHELRPSSRHRLAADLLRDRARIGVGGVEEVPARVEEAVHEGEGGLLVAAPARHPEGHRAETDLGNPEAAPAESSNAHRATVYGGSGCAKGRGRASLTLSSRRVSAPWPDGPA